jgi:phage baseplate assembly protein gpV
VHQLFNLMRLNGSLPLNGMATTRIGTISAYDGKFSVKVTLQPQIEESANQISESNWIPLATPWAGNGWGMFCAPEIGSQVDVHFAEGNWQVAYASLHFFSDVDQALSVPSKEFWLVHSSGSFIKLKNDGKIEISSGTSVNVLSPETNISVNGSSLKKLVTEAMVTFFNTHTHGGGAIPDQTMGNAQLTASLKAD